MSATHQYWNRYWKRQSDAYRLSLATGIGCLGAAGALALCSTTTAALHSAQGIAVVGAFYLVLAICEARLRISLLATQPIPRSLQARTSLPAHSDSYPCRKQLGTQLINRRPHAAPFSVNPPRLLHSRAYLS